MADQTLAVMERFNAALERHDIEGMLAEMAEDTVFENTSPRRMGRVSRASVPCASSSRNF